MRAAAPGLLALALLLLVGSASGAREPWVGNPPYGRALMTRAELKTYWREWMALQTDEERRAYWDAHVAKMQQRVAERGLSDPVRETNLAGVAGKVSFWRPPYFQDIMTDEEQRAYRPSLDAIPDRMDRWRFVANHIRTMYARGVERGVSVPSTYDFRDVFEALGELPPDVEDWLRYQQELREAENDEADAEDPYADDDDLEEPEAYDDSGDLEDFGSDFGGPDDEDPDAGS